MIANTQDLNFVIRMKDRMSQGMAAVKGQFRAIAQEVKRAGGEAAFLTRNFLGVQMSLDSAAAAAVRFSQAIMLKGTHSAMLGLAGAAQLVAAAIAGNGLTGLMKFGSAVGLLPRFLGTAAKSVDGLREKFSFMDKILERMQASKNPFVKLVGWIAMPAAQLASLTLAMGKLKGLADFELKLFKRPMIIGPLLEQLQKLAEIASGALYTGVDKASGGLFSMINRLNGLKNALDTISGPIGQATFAMTALVASMKGLSDLKEFDKQFQKAFTVGDAPIKFRGAIEKELKAISLATGKKMSELAEAFTMISGAGYDGADALDILEQSAKGAASGLGDTKDVATFLMPVMKLYTDQVGDATVANDKLMAAVQQGMGETEDFARNFGQVFGVARQAGVSFDELISAVSALTLSGMNASEAVTVMRQSITDAIGPSRQGINILAKYGMTVEEMQQKVRDNGIVATVAEMEKKLSMLDFQRLFDQVQGRQGMLQLANDLKEEYATVLKAVAEDANGKIAESFETLNTSAFFAFERAATVVNNLLMDLGRTVAPMVNSALNWMADNFDTVSGALKQVALWLATFFITSKVGPAIANALASAFNIVSETASTMISLVTRGFNAVLGTAMNVAKSLPLGFRTAFANIIAGALNLPRVFASVFNMFRSGTLLRQLPIIAGAAFRSIASSAMSAGKAIQYGFTHPLQTAKLAATLLGTGIKGLGGAMKSLGSVIGQVGGIIGRSFFGVLGFLISTLLDVILMVVAFGDQWEWFTKIGGKTVMMMDVMMGTFDWLGYVVGQAIDWVKKKFGEMADAAKPWIDPVISGALKLWDTISVVFKFIGNVLEFLMTSFMSWASLTVDSIMLVIDGFMELWDVVTNVFQGIWKAIESTFKGDFNAAGQAMIDGLAGALSPDRVAARFAKMQETMAEIGRAGALAWGDAAKDEAAIQAKSLEDFILQRAAKRQEVADYAGSNAGTFMPGVPTKDGGDGEMPGSVKNFTATLSKLHTQIEETYRLVEANELWADAADAGTEAVLRAATGTKSLLDNEDHLKLIQQKRVEISQQLIDQGQAGKFTQEQITQMAMIQAAVEEKQRREAQLKLEAFTLSREEAERIAKIEADMGLTPAQREANIAAVQREIEIRKERRILSEQEIADLQKTTEAEQRYRAIIDTVQRTRDLTIEAQLTKDLMGLRYESGEQMAVETARLQALSEMRKKHGDALTAEAYAYIAAAEASARAQYAADTRPKTLGESIKTKVQEWGNEINNVASNMVDAIAGAIDRTADVFTDFFMGQKVEWADFARSIIADISRVITKMLVLKAVEATVKSFGGGDGISDFFAEVFKSAKGNVFGAQAFARGSAFANSVVSSPTYFPFANGGMPRMGLMGEAGPEAVMPLTRLPGGKLGVESRGGGGGQQIIDARTTIIVEMKEVSDPAAARKQGEEAAKMIREMLAQKEQQRLVQLQRASRRITYGANK